MKPSDISPLFSDEDISPAEIARARRIVAWVELEAETKEYRRIARELDYTIPSDAPIRGMFIASQKRIIQLALELFPESEKS